jgi:hypothetical protein
LDWNNNDRKVVLSYLKPPENFIVATDDRKLWAASLYCIHGKHIGDEYNWKIFMSYVNELKGVALLLHKPLLKFAYNVVFWKKWVPAALREHPVNLSRALARCFPPSHDPPPPPH